MISQAASITGILGAMPEEVEGILTLLSERRDETIGMRQYSTGIIHGKRVVIAFSRWGKVAAAATVTTMIQRYGITELIFTGVAGAISPALRVGDVVMADRLVQHDMDARPFIPRFEIPLLGLDFFNAHHPSKTAVADTLTTLLNDRSLHQIFSEDTIQRYQLHHPGFFSGDIASGDHFFSSRQSKLRIQQDLPSVLCVEMEGAAVAQICYEYEIPFLVIRIISDDAHENAHIDFAAFTRDIASRYAQEIINRIVPVL